MLTIFTRSRVCSLIHSYVHSYVHSFTVRSLVCLIVHRMFARSHSRSSYVHIHVHRMFAVFTVCLSVQVFPVLPSIYLWLSNLSRKFLANQVTRAGAKRPRAWLGLPRIFCSNFSSRLVGGLPATSPICQKKDKNLSSGRPARLLLGQKSRISFAGSIEPALIQPDRYELCFLQRGKLPRSGFHASSACKLHFDLSQC